MKEESPRPDSRYRRNEVLFMDNEDLPVEEESSEEIALSTRDKILNAALEVFAGKGLHGATVVEIANAAGITGGALYRYFDSKEEIFQAVVGSHSETIQALEFVRELIPELEPKTALKFIARGMFFVFYSDWDFLRMVIGEAIKNPDAAGPFLERMMNPGRDFVRECLELWKEKSIIKEDVDSNIATISFLGPLGYILVDKDIFEDPAFENVEITDMVDQAISIFLDGILK